MPKSSQFMVSPIDEKMRAISARIIVDIAKPGVTLRHPESEKKINFFPFTHIQSWLSSKQAFGLQVLDGKQEVETLWFRTKESEDLISALKACVDEILADRKKSASAKKKSEALVTAFIEKSPQAQADELRNLVAECTGEKDEEKQRMAMWKIALLVGVSDPAKEELVSAGHMESLLVLCQSSDPKLQCNLGGIVANCAQVDELRATIATIGAVRPMITLAQSKVPEVRRVAAAVLALLSANAEVRDDLSKRGALHLFASMMKHNDDPVLQRSALCGFAALACDARYHDVVQQEGSVKDLVAMARMIQDAHGKTAELISCQVAEAVFMLSFHDAMKYELIVNGAVACLGNMMSRNEKRTQRFVVGALQNILGATGNKETAVDADVEKMALTNEVSEMRARLEAAESKLSAVGEPIDKATLEEQTDKVRMLYEIAKDLANTQYPEGDEDFEKIVEDGEEALSWIENAAEMHSAPQ